MKTIADVIKQIRKELKLSQKDFANVLGYNYRVVGSWENGRSKPGIDTIKLIHDKFNVEYEDIFDYDL